MAKKHTIEQETSYQLSFFDKEPDFKEELFSILTSTLIVTYIVFCLFH